ncbi:hypothetical protein SLEP1_g10072 [Rubroshorea leprosula]|uniref:Phosphomannomutase n=1 Tax=Rubroshorea leprosula TaxID=152421 RepID=A0AAV5ICU9_9ROSI|nr:hypothetical protein SLEP1_g10072 [Rubroshorea leprosula]
MEWTYKKAHCRKTAPETQTLGSLKAVGTLPTRKQPLGTIPRFMPPLQILCLPQYSVGQLFLSQQGQLFVSLKFSYCEFSLTVFLWLTPMAVSVRKPGLIALFDVDGTLTAPRKVAAPQMLEFMRQLRKVVTVGVVGGSDLTKISEQLGKTVIADYDYVFSENGLVAHQDGKLIGTQSLKSFLEEEKLKNFEVGCSMNVSPIGRNCSQEERDDFEKYDKIHNIRPKMVSVLREKFAHLNLTFSIGGQISFDVFPQGWDKTYCLRYLDDFQEIHFFGDKTYKGGNDHEIYESERTVGHTVTSPEDTMEQCKALFLSNH